MSSISIRIMSSESEVALFAEEWQALEKKAALATRASYATFMSWWGRYGHVRNRRLGQAQELCVVAIYKDQRLAGCLPLERVRRKKRFYAITELVFLSQPMNGAILDLIQDGLSQAEAAQVFSLLKRQLRYDLLNLAYLPESSMLRRLFPKDVYLHSAIPFIAVGGGYEAVRGNEYSQNLKQVLNKFQRRIREAAGRIEGKMLMEPEAIRAMRAQIERVSNSKLKSADMHSIYQDPLIGEKYFASIMEKSEPYLSAYVTDGGTLLAYNLGFRQGDTVYYLDTAYDRGFADAQKIGLGILALDQMVRHFSGQCRVVDLGFGLDDYKFRFTRKAALTWRLLLPGNGIFSRLLFWQTRKKVVSGAKELQKGLDKYDIKAPD